MTYPVSRGMFRREKVRKSNQRATAIMLLSGATDPALARMTPESLAHSYGLKMPDAAQLLEDERSRRRGRAHG